MTKYEPDLEMNHPGFADQVYRARKKKIAETAFAYKFGDPIRHINYTKTENKIWSVVFTRVKELMTKHACSEYVVVFKKLEDEKIFVKERIPQLQEMSDFLRKNTSFTLRLAADRLPRFACVSHLPEYPVRPKHQLAIPHTRTRLYSRTAVHMSLRANLSFAQFSQEICLASLGASDDKTEKLCTVYWFTVEFGLYKENNEIKAYGAGLLSASRGLLHAISDKPEYRAFEPASTVVQPNQDQEYQPIYYVAESFEEAKQKFRRWVSPMSQPFEVRFNLHTERVEVLDSVDKLNTLVSQLNTEIQHLTNAVAKLRQPFWLKRAALRNCAANIKLSIK